MHLDLIYALALGMGLASGFSHCVGMCGIFVVSYAGMPDKGEARRFVHPMRHLLFHGGRLASLALLGLLGGTIGALGHRWAFVGGVLSLAVGVGMLGLALGLAGVLPKLRLPEPDVLGAGGGRGRRLYRRVLQSHSRLRPLGIGVCVGLLPCGLTYTALQATFPLRPLSGACLMLLFGLDPYVKLAIAVDEDVDVFREEEVLWAMATRFQADTDMFMVPKVFCNRLDPSSVDGMSAKLGLDATAPLTWDVARTTLPPEAVAWAAALIARTV